MVLVQISWILSCHSSPYHPLLLAGLLDDILYSYRTVVHKFLLVIQHFLIYVKGSIGEHCL